MDKHVKFGGGKKKDIRARAGPFIFFTERLTRASIAFGYSDTLCRLYSMSPGLIVTTFGLGSLLSATVVACTRPAWRRHFPCRSIVFVGGPSPLFLALSLPLQEVVEGAKKPTEDGSEAGGSL